MSEAINYVPGEWCEAKTREELAAFFASRIPAIREAAREQGYAIGLHGSMRRDLDLIAVPWREGASDKDVLAHAIAVAACGITRDGDHQWEVKPLGRLATSLPCCWPSWYGEAGAGHIDLSVMAPQPAPSPQPAAPVVSDEQIRKTVESIQDPDTVHAFHNGYYTLTPEELRRAILALRPQAEIDVRNTPFGKEAEKLAADYLALMSECAGLREQLASLRPQAVPMTDSVFDLICNAIDKADTITMQGDYMMDSDDCINVVRTMQALIDVCGITAPAGGEG